MPVIRAPMKDIKMSDKNEDENDMILPSHLILLKTTKKS